jgi:uncharacterized protein (TIGR00299 family) protein
MSILYCDCFSGISGDMFLGALVDAGLPVEYLDSQLQRLGLPEYVDVAVRKVRKGALQASLLQFVLRDATAERAEEPAPQGGDDRPPQAGHQRHTAAEQNSVAPHGHERTLDDIARLIQQSGLPEAVQRTSQRIFQKLAEAEAAVHGCPVSEVHFHEVGATDSILDIVGAAVGLHYLDVTAVYASALPLGSGQVRTRHGLLPLPAPATLELLRAAQAPLVPTTATQELVTPTGAAILCTLATFTQPAMALQRVGIGAGQRDLEWPNVLRVLIGDPCASGDTHVEIETNIDDMNPQLFGAVMGKLFANGALDVFFTPIYMKKNRPATRISVIGRQADEERLSQILLRETTTLGVRVKTVRRYEAGRETRRVMTRWGEALVKIKLLDGMAVQASPEYESCVQLAEAAGVPVADVLQEVAAAGAELIRET